jgi:hypothetical membrane protein
MEAPGGKLVMRITRGLSAGRLPAALGLLGACVALLTLIASLASAPWFSWEVNAISDLGTHTGTQWIFRTGILASGCLFTVFAVGLNIGNGALKRAGRLLLVAGCVSLILVGAVSEGEVHLAASVCFFSLVLLSMLMIGIAWLIERRTALGAASVILALACGLVWVAGIGWLAVREALSSFSFMAWGVCVSARAMRERRLGLSRPA